MESTQGRHPEVGTKSRRGAAGGDGSAREHHDEIDLTVPEPRPLWVGLAGAVVLLVLVALLLAGLVPRHRQEKELEADAEAAADAPVPVNATRPRRAPQVVNLTLPATLRPWQEVSIFARTSGYLKKYYVDISQPVEKGQLLAEIDTPEVEQELRQAQATVQQTKAFAVKAQADLELARVTWDRYKQLIEAKHISVQEADEKRSAVTAGEATLASANANVAAAEASVRRLTETLSFQKVYAPFSGVITGRAYDVGSLISANPQNVDIKPMYKIAQNDVVRAFVNVPQSSALQIRKGMDVKVTARERPGRVFPGVVMGTTNYLDPTNRSLLTEVKVPNEKESGGEFSLLPGMYVQVNVAVQRDTPPLMVPAPALVTTAEGTQVAVAKDGAAHFHRVTIGQDFGSEIEIVEGLTGDEAIIANPGERITEGAKVATGPGEAKTENAAAQPERQKPAGDARGAKVVNAAAR
jgi:RND family efflux transporter MFP subunit